MDPAAQSEQVENYLASNHRLGTQNMTLVLRFLEIMVGVLFYHLTVGVITRDRGVEGAAPLDLRWRMRQSGATFGQMSGSTEVLWHIVSPLTLLFCVMNVSIKKVAARRYASVSVAAKTLWPHLKAIYSIRKGVISNLDPV